MSAEICDLRSATDVPFSCVADSEPRAAGARPRVRLTAEPAGEALVVLHTPPGEANRVAVALDRLAWPDVVGTIAGDDTIFLAVKDGAAQRRVLGDVRRLSGGERRMPGPRRAES